MGRCITPAFGLFITLASGKYATPMTWHCRKHYGIPGYGKPNNANLAKWVKGFEESCVTGANKHLGPETIRTAKIVRLEDDVIVAAYQAESVEDMPLAEAMRFEPR